MSQPTPASDDATSPTLLNDARGRDPEAWRRLVVLYGPAVFAWAKRTGLNDEDAADIVQEVWAAVSTRLDTFRKERPADTFRGWLWTVTRNKVRDLHRKRDDSVAAAGGSDAQAALNQVPEVEPADESGADNRGLLTRALDLIRADFEETTWQAFWRMVVLGQPARQVADDLGMAANAAYQARFRVLKRLRKELSDLGVADDPSFAGVVPGA
jgi:RNA polymerase sigma-70 factor (ECF subfamily)